MIKENIFFLLFFLVLVFSACKKTESQDKRPINDSIEVSVQFKQEKTPQDTLNWEGEYKGILPCADCDGMEMSIMLNFDLSFTQTINYIGRGGPYEETGLFDWDDTGHKIMLTFKDSSIVEYLIKKDEILQLDKTGEIIDENVYVLKK